ncbi:hypothetical protein [Zavarzinia compransoris]|uniref:hypothetical protein n=1 Tax=Zavarzinia compransoris TaxID=1264899 RepID=UPI0010D6412C|nr:hypothetical protein [Zavarzinia compransoris]TDP47126.1 hypothetical protein DES42_103296 [Zavarzinia compransoris]
MRPWNKWAGASRDAKLAARADLAAPALADLVALGDAGFRRRFATTPVEGLGRARAMS